MKGRSLSDQPAHARMDSRRSTRARPLPIRWHFCTSGRGEGGAVGRREARCRHLYPFAQFRVGRTPGIARARPGPPGRKGGRACLAQGEGEHLDVRVRGAGARTRAAHLLAGAPGPARHPERPARRGRRQEGQCERGAPGGGGGGPGITMAELLWSLQDSQLVARFQRRCGLFPAPDEGPGEPCAGPAEGAARAPGLGHLPAAKGRGAGEPANGLRRVAVPQVTAGQVFAVVGGGDSSPHRLRTCWSRRLCDAAMGARRSCRAERAPYPSGDPAARAVGTREGWVGVQSLG